MKGVGYGRLKKLIGRAWEIYRNRGGAGLAISIKNVLRNKLQNMYSSVSIVFGWLRRGKIMYPSGSGWVIYDVPQRRAFHFPQFDDQKRYRETYKNRVDSQYFSSDYVSVKQGDVVLDVGAFLGLTSIFAAERAEMVYAIEPSPRALQYLKKNTAKYDNITVLPYACWNESTEIELKFGGHSSEDSLIEPDDGGIDEGEIVQAFTIKDVITEINIEEVDFLKVEGEGVEPEIVEGMEGANVTKVVVSGTAERWGEFVYEEVSEQLEEYGYSVSVEKPESHVMVYGKRDGSS